MTSFAQPIISTHFRNEGNRTNVLVDAFASKSFNHGLTHRSEQVIAMKIFNSLLLFVTFGAVLLINSAFAPTNAYDDAYHYAYASASWYSFYNTAPGINYGFGFNTWVVRTNGPGSHGFFTTRNATPLPP